MLSHMPRLFRHSTVACAIAVACVASALHPRAAAAQTRDTSQLLVFIHGTALGNEESTLTRTQDGWTVRGSNRLAPPLDLTTRQLLVRYAADWRPLELVIDATVRGSGLKIRTSFAGTTATSDITQFTQTGQKTDQVAADTIVLPNLFFASYEVLAMRLVETPGEAITLSAYIAPQAEITVEARRLEGQSIQTQRGAVRATRFALTFNNPGNPLAAELWADDRGRLLRFEVPTQGLVVIRDDIATVTARRQNIARAFDENVRIPGSGFGIAATISRPTGEPDRRGRYPAVILVPGSGPVDRDETVAGIPVFGQIANALADAGFVVVRYDKRGVGQTGGRAETTTIEDAAEDVLAVKRFIARRRNVDSNRIALFGHSEGAWVALVAAARQRDIAALVLAAAPATTGGELVLEQQQHLLQQMSLPEAEKQKRVELQKQVQAAVLGQGDWSGVPLDLRHQADTQWFQSFLGFSPAKVMPRVRQPILLLQGELDRQVPPHHAEKLEELARARKRPAIDPVRRVVFSGVNHLFTRATTGEVTEYATLPQKEVVPDVASTTAEWLREVFARRR
jgi:uncharacterized protein